MPLAFNPGVAAVQTEGSYLSQDHALLDQSDEQEQQSESSASERIKKTALSAWSTFHEKIMPLVATGSLYLMPRTTDVKGKGPERNPSTVAMYEKSRASLSYDSGVAFENDRTSTSLDSRGPEEKAKQQWVEDVSANFKERRFSFNLPVREAIPVIEGVAIEPVEYYKKDMSFKGNSDVDVRDFADYPFSQADHFEPEHVEPEQLDDNDEFEGPNLADQYMIERAADKAKRGEMMNKLPTVPEQQEDLPLFALGGNIPVVPQSQRSPLSRSPVAKLPLGTNHLQKRNGPLAVQNPDSPSKPVEREERDWYRVKHYMVDPKEGHLRTWSQATTAEITDEGATLSRGPVQFKRPVPPRATDMDVCEKPARTLNWLKNVPLSKSWKQQRQTTQKQKYGTYVDPFQAYVDARNGVKEEEVIDEMNLQQAKKGNEVLKNTLRNWNPFQVKKGEGDSGYEGSPEESPRGRPRERVQHPGTTNTNTVQESVLAI